MCSGLRDAANLAWKLAAVTRDGADDCLLDTYQPERAPNLRAMIDMAIMMGKTVCITSPFGAWLRDMKFKLGRALGKPCTSGSTAWQPRPSWCDPTDMSSELDLPMILRLLGPVKLWL